MIASDHDLKDQGALERRPGSHLSGPQSADRLFGAEQYRPPATRSVKTAVEDLKSARLWVVYPGKAAYPLTEKIQEIPLADVPDV